VNPYLDSRRKRMLDVVGALVALVVFAPVLAVAAVAIRLEGDGHYIYRQRRVGRSGAAFELFKLRTMVSGAEHMGSGLAVDAGDERITRVGALLRRTSLDELPQLLNVLKGEMSLIGPRPERPDFARLFGESIYRYDERHRVKAGITGWAQVHGLRNKTSLRDRVEWDNFYIENWSLWLDVKILLMTCWAVVGYFAKGE
jgi:lipopolysaccharide/colanic/teichoic acid biosynthesis glycosyltransferase